MEGAKKNSRKNQGWIIKGAQVRKNLERRESYEKLFIIPNSVLHVDILVYKRKEQFQNLFCNKKK